MLKLTASAIAVAALMSCTDAAAPRIDPPAYDPTQLSGGFVYRWPTGTVISVFVDPTATGSGMDLAGVVTSGTAAWKAALGGAQFAFRSATAAADADVIVHLSTAPRLVGLAGCAEPQSFAGGVTFFCPARDSALTLPLISGPGTGRVNPHHCTHRSPATSPASFADHTPSSGVRA